MNFLPQTTIQPVSGSQAAKAAAGPMTRPDLPDLTQASDAPGRSAPASQEPRTQTCDRGGKDSP